MTVSYTFLHLQILLPERPAHDFLSPALIGLFRLIIPQPDRRDRAKHLKSLHNEPSHAPMGHKPFIFDDIIVLARHTNSGLACAIGTVLVCFAGSR